MLRRYAVVVLAAAAALLLAAAGAAALTLSLPGTITAEADGPTGADVTYTASASNPQSKPVGVSCDGPGGGSANGSLIVTARFPLGTTTVTCTAGDGEDTVSGSFQVLVQDTTPPAVAVPSPTEQEATGPNGATAAYGAAAASDVVDGPLVPQCAPASGSLFPLGTTPVTCTATDAAGNTGSGSFAVVVRDTTPPTLTAPAPVSVATAGTTAVPATNATIAGFLAGASATDLVDPAPAITNDAPTAFPVGTTIVRFTATDAAGNRAEATSTVTVTSSGTPTPPPPPQPPATPPPPAPPPPPGPPPPPQTAAPDTTPPGDVVGLRIQSGNRRALLTWRLPPDSDLDVVAVTRRAGTAGTAARTVYLGRGSRFEDRNLRNGVVYRYLVAALDRAGNRSAGVAASARPTAPKLVQPPDGARLTKPPRLVWVRVANADYYNVQLFRGSTKVLSVWPISNRFALPRTWSYGGRRHSLTAGLYRWYVWAGFGPRSLARYGPVLGESTFTVTR
jgi:HYR domain